MADGGIINTIPDATRNQFASEWEHQQQVMQSAFAAAGLQTESRWTAKDFYFDLLEPIEWEEEAGRFAETNPDEVQNWKVRGTKKRWKARPKVFDRLDKHMLDTLPLPDGEVMQAMKYGYERMIDRVIAIAATGSKWIGPEDSQVLTAFPSANQVPANFVLTGAAAQSNLTIPKLVYTEELFRRKGVDPVREDVFIALSQNQISALFTWATAQTNDGTARLFLDWYNNRNKPDAKLLGMYRVIISNDLPLFTGTADIRICPVFVRRAFTQSPRQYDFRMDILADNSHALQLAAYDFFGVVRRQDDLVLHILCDEQL
jgi:hypothetical protein